MYQPERPLIGGRPSIDRREKGKSMKKSYCLCDNGESFKFTKKIKIRLLRLFSGLYKI